MDLGLGHTSVQVIIVRDKEIREPGQGKRSDNTTLNLGTEICRPL